MKAWTLCDPVTGLFTGAIVRCSDDQIEANSRSKHDRRPLLAVEGWFDHRSQRLDVALLEASKGDLSPPQDFVVDHQPPKPSDDHEWIATNPGWADRAAQRWRWVKKPEAVQRERDEQRVRQFIADLETTERFADEGRLSAAQRATLERFNRT